MRSVRVPTRILRAIVSSGSGALVMSEHVDDDLEFFEEDKPLRCLWCYSPSAPPDDKGRIPKCVSCNRHGTTRLEMKEKRMVYIEEID